MEGYSHDCIRTIPGSRNDNPYTGPTNTASNGGTGTTSRNGNVVGKNGGFPAGPNNANNAGVYNEPMNEQYSPAVDKTAVLQSTINALLQIILQKQSYGTNPQVVYINGHDQMSGSRYATNTATSSNDRGQNGSRGSAGNGGSTGVSGNSGNAIASAMMPSAGVDITGSNADMPGVVGADITGADAGQIGDGILNAADPTLFGDVNTGHDFDPTNNDMVNNINRYYADIDNGDSCSSNTNYGKYGQVQYAYKPKPYGYKRKTYRNRSYGKKETTTTTRTPRPYGRKYARPSYGKYGKRKDNNLLILVRVISVRVDTEDV